MVDLWRDFWICETGTSQQVAQLDDHDDDDDDDDWWHGMHLRVTYWRHTKSSLRERSIECGNDFEW